MRPISSRPPLVALRRWQQAAGPFAPYVGATPFLSLGKPAGDATGQAPTRPAEVPSALRPRAGEALFLDLAPEATLGFAHAYNLGGVAVVPIMHRWSSDSNAVLSLTPILRLVSTSGGLRRTKGARSAVFLLDGERAGPRALRGRTGLARLDNRYRYSLHAFPPPPALGACGMTGVRLVSAGTAAEDLWEYLALLDSSGFKPVLETLP